MILLVVPQWATAARVPDPARTSAMYYEYHDVPSFSLNSALPAHNTFTWSLDNNGTSYVGPWESSATLGLNHILGQESQVEIMNIAIPHDHNYKQWRLAFIYPLLSNTLSLFGNYLTIRNSPLNLDQGLSFKSQLDSFTLGLRKTLHQTPQQLLKGALKFTHKRLYNRINTTHQKDSLGILNATLNWNFKTRDHDQNTLAMDLYQGIGGSPFTVQKGPNASRKKARPGFTKIKFFFQRSENFNALPLGYTLLSHGQLAFSPLPETERMPIAGAPIMNAYSFGTLIGDSALETKLTLHLNLPALGPLHNLQLYTYHTHGIVWNRTPASYEKKRDSLSASSVGLSGDLSDHISWFVEYAWPHKKTINYESSKPALYVGFTFAI